MTFDLDREVRLAASRVLMLIELRAAAAVDRLWDMHTIELDVCYCGSDMEGHGAWDNHAPRAGRVDKSYG